ncbi:MAG: hypothetical protein QW319_04750 [Candidatus Nitrosocaldus sp.]
MSNEQVVSHQVGGHAGRTPALLSSGLKRENVPPVYKAISWRRARRFARAIMSRHDLLYEQIEERLTYQPDNLIIKSKSMVDLEQFLPSKVYTTIYAFSKSAKLMADIRLAKSTD